MPYKQKKNQSPLKNGSQPAESEQSVPGGSSFSHPVAMTDYREIHVNETEALRSIYGDDFEDVESKRSAWHVG